MSEPVPMYQIKSKQEAFAPTPGEVSIPIDHTQHDFVFRRRWFKVRNQCTVSTFLPPRYPADKPWNVLCIGIFEAANEVWLMQNILKHPKSRLVALDPWAELLKLGVGFMDQAYLNAQSNLSPWKDQVTFVRGYSQEVLPEAIKAGHLCGIEVGDFDFLVVDGNHTAEPAYIDMCNCYELGRKNSWIFCDDVRNRTTKTNHVKDGLERFLSEYWPDRVSVAWEHRFVSTLEKIA